MIIKLLLKSIFLYILIYCPVFSFAQTKVFDMVVAQDGTGDYTTINTAVSRYSNSRKIIFIKNGTYKEKILVDAAKTNMRMIGESANGVVITYDDYAGKSGVNSTADSYTVRIEGNGFYAENITFQNTATQAQAVAIYTKADTVVFKNCRFLGYQDTHFADKGRQYFLNCETRGDVDFIFGSAAIMYDNSTIISRSRKGGYITAPAEAVITSTKTGGGTNIHGIVIKNSLLTAETGLAANSCFLGRPWGANSSSVFMNCKIDNHIKPEGWSVWTTSPTAEGYNNHNTAFFAEYNNKNKDGVNLDVSQRVTWSKQLTSADTALYSIGNFFKGWDPTIKTLALSAPINLITRNDTLFWKPVESARGYIVIRNDTIAGFSTTASFNISGKTKNSYKVRTVNRFGGIGEISQTATSIYLNLNSEKYFVYISNHVLYVPENQIVEIYNVLGTLVKTSVSDQTISMSDLCNGVYIVRIKLDKKGTTITRKIKL